MAKRPRAKSKTVKPEMPQTPAAPAPARTLMEFTEQGFDALVARRLSSAKSGKSAKEGRAFADAVERLKANYERLLRRHK